MDYKAELHKLLIRVAKKPKKFGICFMVNSVMRRHYTDTAWIGIKTELADLIQTWPKARGSRTYPIPGVNGLSAAESYCEYNHVEFWDADHPYGALRLELLEFLLMETGKK